MTGKVVAALGGLAFLVLGNHCHQSYAEFVQVLYMSVNTDTVSCELFDEHTYVWHINPCESVF